MTKNFQTVMTNDLYTFIGVLGAAAAFVWIAPAWMATGLYVAGRKAKDLLARG